MESVMGCKRVEPVWQCVVCFAGVEYAEGNLAFDLSKRFSGLGGGDR